MSIRRHAILATCAALLGVPVAANAALVTSLPYSGTPDWTDITFSGTSMVTDGSQSVLTTANTAGVWFGWGPQANYGDEPAWAPGSNEAGNYLRLEASFSADAADWSTYLNDLDYLMGLSFAHTGCTGNSGPCYGLDGAAGVTLSHPGTATFVPLDLTESHVYEVLLKDGLVEYRIDGTRYYAGAAAPASLTFPLLVIGDGSGSSLTGRGSMTIHAVEFDTAPLGNVTVPLPPALPLFAAAIAMLGWYRRA